MTTVTENDLKELKQLILQLSERITANNEVVNQKLNDLKVEVAIVKEGLNGTNKRLDDVNKRIDDTNTRIGSIDFLIRVIVGFTSPPLLRGVGGI